MSHIVLRVTHPEAPGNGVTPEVRIGAEGGMVGRGGQCDMVLPDPSNLVSRRHFEVAYREGRFEAVDLSSNGLFVNGAAEPIGNGRSVALSEGDRLGVGDYVLRVEAVVTGGKETRPDIENTFGGNPFAPVEDRPPRAEPPRDGGGENPFGLPEGLESNPFEADGGDDWLTGPDEPVAPSIGAGADEDAEGPLIPEDFDPLEDLGLEPGQGAQPDHAPGWNVPLDNVMKSRPEPPAEPDPEPDREPAPRPAPAARPEGTAAPSAPAEGQAGEAMAAFWKAAGLEPGAAGTAGPEEAGRLFGALVRGLWETLRARTAFKEEFRVERTMLGAAGNNPLKFAIDEQQALEHLARPETRGFMPPQRAVEESFDDIRNHEMAMLAAMHRALSHVLEEFDPEALESRLEGMSLLDALPGGRRARYWDLYVKHYAEIARKAEDIFEGALGREFVKAYERASGGNRGGEDQ